MTIDQEFNCLGYFGFGNGVSMFRKEGAFCNGCVMKTACWQAHRARVHQAFPDLAAHIDELGKQEDGQKKIMAFVEEHKIEPFMSMMLGNTEDALLISHGQGPKNRGPHTLKYPFRDDPSGLV